MWPTQLLQYPKMTRMLLRRIPVYGAQRVFHLKQNLDKYILNRFCSSSTAHIASKYENVRKLVVGLGNPGPQYTHTRCVSFVVFL
jgi:hypothetical protein